MLLHEMDYLKYVSVRRDYIVLPERALTNATRLRWWQPFSLRSGLVRPSVERAQWALDNILVGGSDINPSTLLDTFDDGELTGYSLYKALYGSLCSRVQIFFSFFQRASLTKRAGASIPTQSAQPGSAETPLSICTGPTRTSMGHKTSWPPESLSFSLGTSYSSRSVHAGPGFLFTCTRVLILLSLDCGWLRGRQM